MIIPLPQISRYLLDSFVQDSNTTSPDETIALFADGDSQDGTSTREKAVYALTFTFFVGFGLVLHKCLWGSYNRANPSTREQDARVDVWRQTFASNGAQAPEDLVQSMSSEERRIYVTNLLKTGTFQSTVTHTTGTSVDTVTSKDNNTAKNWIITKSKLSEGDQIAEEYCAICLEDFQKGDEVCSSQNSRCSHKFHQVCIFEWLLKNSECPCCRRQYLTSFEIGADVEEAVVAASSPAAAL